MRAFVFLLATSAAALFAFASSTGAVPYHPWCARYFDVSSATVCAFDSQAQCQATVSGVGGSCMSNAAPPPPGFAPYGPGPYERAQRARRRHNEER